MIGLAMISRIVSDQKADFFLGLVVLQMAGELLFSWGGSSGYNNSPGAFPYWIFMNYLLIPPSVWLFVNYNTDDNFKFQKWHYLLFLPAFVAYGLELWSRYTIFSLMDYAAWIWFSDYLPMAGLLYVVGFFWYKYLKLNRAKAFVAEKTTLLNQAKLLSVMTSLSLLGFSWLVFTIIGWEYFILIEYVLISFFYVFAFFHFLEGRTFPSLELEEKNREFPNYDDEESLGLLDDFIKERKPFLQPNLPLKELASELGFPPRYVSFLINYYHNKNYKEFINQFRIETFLLKAKSGEKDYKTLLGLALESGFSSKSTFNQVFKTHIGKSPSEYLN